MDSSGRIHMMDEIAPSRPSEPARYADRVVTQWPIPAQCDARKVLKALEKLDGVTAEVAASDATLVPLSPFERGYVLGLREYMAVRKDRP